MWECPPSCCTPPSASLPLWFGWIKWHNRQKELNNSSVSRVLSISVGFFDDMIVSAECVHVWACSDSNWDLSFRKSLLGVQGHNPPALLPSRHLSVRYRHAQTGHRDGCLVGRRCQNLLLQRRQVFIHLLVYSLLVLSTSWELKASCVAHICTCHLPVVSPKGRSKKTNRKINTVDQMHFNLCPLKSHQVHFYSGISQLLYYEVFVWGTFEAFKLDFSCKVLFFFINKSDIRQKSVVHLCASQASYSMRVCQCDSQIHLSRYIISWKAGGPCCGSWQKF